MSSQLLLLLKFSLLALLYLFLLRVVRAVWAELSPPAPEDVARPMTPAASPSPSGASVVGADPVARGRGVPKSSPPTGAVGAVGTLPAPPGAGSGPPLGVAGDPGVPGAPGAATGRLVVVSPPELAGRSAEVVPSGIVVGRGGGCDLVVEDSYVSQRHLRVSPSGSQAWLVEDLGSTNGTFVDDERLTAPRVIGLGELVSLGGVVVTLR